MERLIGTLSDQHYCEEDRCRLHAGKDNDGIALRYEKGQNGRIILVCPQCGTKYLEIGDGSNAIIEKIYD